MALSFRLSPIGTTASMSCALNCRGRGWRGGNGGQLGSQSCQGGGLQVSCASSTGPGCWCVDAYKTSSPINSYTSCSATLGSTEFPNVFEVLRLSEESSGGPFPSSSRATEKAVKVSRAAVYCGLTEPISTAVLVQAKYETREDARGARNRAGATVNRLRCGDASAYGKDGNAVLNIDTKSSHLLGHREVLMDVEASKCWEVDSLVKNLPFTRIAGEHRFSMEAIDDNHYQDAGAALTSSVSKEDFWPDIEVEEMVADKCISLDQWRQYQPVMHNPEKHVPDRHFNRCIHHLLAVLSLPRVGTIDKEPICCEQEHKLGSNAVVKMNLEANVDDGNNSLASRTSGSDELVFHKPVLHLWNGFWVGPDDEDGWGVVEALVSPVDIDGPFCRT
ncbi:unnamed protein product [Calypogeia fissa]